eukprot:scaffold54757_cov60-Cyclotella_meneghiniana.AAC.8
MVVSGGISMKYNSIAYLAIAGQAGDDEITVQSTDPNLFLSLYGGLGSDRFIITPSITSPVRSRNTRGHRGIIEHTVSSNDAMYDGLFIRGIEANVIDNDGGWIYVVDHGRPHLMTQDGHGAFSFSLYPTTLPENDLYVNIVAPAEHDEADRPFVLVNGLETAILHWAQGDMTPKQIDITYNADASELGCTEMNLMLELHVDLGIGRTFDHRFENGGRTLDTRFFITDQHLLPVEILLLPKNDNMAGAKSLAIMEG